MFRRYGKKNEDIRTADTGASIEYKCLNIISAQCRVCEGIQAPRCNFGFGKIQLQ
jgi:hypothetical protein